MRDYLARFSTEKRPPLSFTSDSEKLRIKHQHNVAGATHSHLYYSKELQKLTSNGKTLSTQKLLLAIHWYFFKSNSHCCISQTSKVRNSHKTGSNRREK